MQAESVYEETKSKHEHDFDVCPHCKKKHVIKSGHNKNTKKQMYRCKDCGKQFTNSYNTLLHGTKKPLSSWIMAIECVLNHDKLSVIAEKCGIHKTNAFYWRHKILDCIQEIVNKEHLKGEIQLDETLVPVASEKETKEEQKKRGISENKINIACAIDQYFQGIYRKRKHSDK